MRIKASRQLRRNLTYTNNNHPMPTRRAMAPLKNIEAAYEPFANQRDEVMEMAIAS